MANVICHICLRTDIHIVTLAEKLADFVDELCDYNIISNRRYKFCTICAHLLKKFYNFKQRCLKACKILKSLKGRPKILPTNLHEQIPSSIGLCNSLAPYKLFEHHHQTDTDSLETKPDLNNEPHITPNNAEVNLEITDPIQPDDIEVKNEPIDDALDSDNETMQVVDGENLYIITTSNDNLTNFDSNCKKVLEANTEELDTTKKDGSQDNAKQSKINDFLKSFGEEIKEIEDKAVAHDTEVKDTTFMLNNDPLKDVGNEDPSDVLRDDESLNSMDDIIESDDSDYNYDVEGQTAEEENFESDSDSDGLSDMLDKAKNKKIRINEIYDLELAEFILKIDKKNRLIKKRVQFLKDKGNIKYCILELFENDEYDLGDGVKISKEAFLKIYDRGERSSPSYINSIHIQDTKDKKKTDEILRYLFRLYNPEYETVFDIEYLDTEEMKLQEFNRRKDREEYKSAPYQCTRCFQGFQVERLHAHHMKKHDESSGAHECPICSLRFQSEARQRAHVVLCHSVVYDCRECHKTFYYLGTMINHFNLHKGKEFPCPICNGIYRTATGLANHKRTHVTSHICSTCARSFVSEPGLTMHRKVKHKDAPQPTAPVRCDKCPLTLDSQHAYKRHLKISHRTHGYVCNCFKSFTSLAELKEHKVDAGHQHCKRVEPGKVGFMNKASGRPRRDPAAAHSTCPVCKEKIPNSSAKAMYNHHRMRHLELPYQPSVKAEDKTSGRPRRDPAAHSTCPVCKEKIPNSSAKAMYNHHRMRHLELPYQPSVKAEDKTYLCELCGKKFYGFCFYNYHMNHHNGVRPYKCSECPRTFTYSNGLLNHKKRHRPPKQKCKVCGKLFKTPSNLNVHMRIHKNDRRYVCSICPATFIHASSLTEHVRGVHQNQRRIRKARKLES